MLSPELSSLEAVEPTLEQMISLSQSYTHNDGLIRLAIALLNTVLQGHRPREHVAAEIQTLMKQVIVPQSERHLFLDQLVRRNLKKLIAHQRYLQAYNLYEEYVLLI